MGRKTILSAFRDPRIWIVVGVVVLVLLLFLLGGTLGLDGERRLLAIIGVLLAGMIALLLVRGSGSRESEKIEKSIILEADSLVVTSSGSQRKASESARDELVRAIEGLKKSRIAGGRSGRSALSVLPWLLVLGRAGSGRSALARGSGLGIPGAGPDSKKTGGVGATKHCEWWFTNQAILLEANGRFVGRDDDTAVGQDWREFLQVVAKARPKLPLNGVILTVSAEDLIRHDTAKLDEQARLLRARLDSVESALGIVCPAYVVVTKADLIHGFSQFFADLDAKGRGQIWGATLPPEPAEGDDWGRVFRREFDLLYRNLCLRRIARMDAEEMAARRGEIYLFPLEFHALRKKLQRFIRTLFEPNAYGANPMFRGFYLTSADQEGVPVEMVVNEVSRVIGLPPRWEDDDRTRVLGAAGTPTPSSSRAPARSAAEPHFLRDLFAKVVLPDSGIAHPTRRTAKRRTLQRIILQAAAGLGLALLVVGLFTSFFRNRNLLKRAVEHSQAAALVTAPSHPGEIESKLRALEPMRAFLVDLDRKDAHPPLTMSFGLYRGKAVNRRARAVYLSRLVDALLCPSRRALETRLFSSYPASPEEYRSYYDDYRAYLMLIDPERGEIPFLADHLAALWSGGALGAGTSEGLREMVKSHVTTAWDHPGDVTYHSAGCPGRNASLLEHASVYIREYWRPDNFYLAMVDEVSDLVPAFTLGSVPGAEQTLTTDTEALAKDPDAAFVPGAFTLKGWQEEMRPRIERSEERIQGDWILKEAFQGQPLDLKRLLLEMYRKDYRARWNRFLSGVVVIPPDGVGVATSRMQELAERTSPLVRVLESAASNLRLKSASDVSATPEIGSIEDDFVALHALFVTQGEGESAKRPLDVALTHAAGLVEMLRQRQESGDVGSSSVQYGKAVLGGALTEKNPIAEAVVFAERHGTGLPGADPECTQAVRAALKRVPEAAWQGVLADAQRMLDVAWGNDVWGPFHDTLHGKYPFQSGGPDAPPAEFTRYFGPGGVFWNFYDADLSPFLDRDGNAKLMFGHGLRVAPETATAIRRATEFRRALFAHEAEAGKLGFTFRVKPSQTKKVSGQAPFVNATRLTVGETRVVYDMGLAKETKVPWPGEQAVESAGLSVTMGGSEPGALQFEGPWAFFRLLEKAKITTNSDTESEAVWRLERAGEYVIEIPYTIRAGTVPHPFRPGFFEFDCPRQIGPGPGGSPAAAAPPG